MNAKRLLITAVLSMATMFIGYRIKAIRDDMASELSKVG